MKPEVTTEEITGFLESLPLHRLPPHQRGDAREIIEAIRARLTEYDALKAENDRLSKQHDQCHDRNNELIKERDALKAQWEHERDNARSWIDEAATQRKRADKAEAEAKRLNGDIMLFRSSVRELSDYSMLEKKRRESAESALALAKPLLETIDRIPVYQDGPPDEGGRPFYCDNDKEWGDFKDQFFIYRAAVQNAAKGEKE